MHVLCLAYLIVIDRMHSRIIGRPHVVRWSGTYNTTRAVKPSNTADVSMLRLLDEMCLRAIVRSPKRRGCYTTEFTCSDSLSLSCGQCPSGYAGANHRLYGLQDARPVVSIEPYVLRSAIECCPNNRTSVQRRSELTCLADGDVVAWPHARRM